MKILIGLSNPEQLELLYSQMDSATVVTVQSYEQLQLQINAPYERIALHCDLFPTTYPWDWMSELKQLYPSTNVMIALSAQTHDSLFNDMICRLAEDFEFTIIPLGLTDHQIVDQFLAGTSRVGISHEKSTELSAHKQKNGKLIAVISASSKDGATTIAVNTAISLAKRTNLNVGLFDLNLKSPDMKDNLNINARGKSLLTLRPKCSSNSLSSVDIIEHCFPYKGLNNLHILLGTNRRDTATDVTMEQIKNLLDAAKRTFDVVIVDIHTFPDNAATIYTLKHADERWIVAQPNYASFKSSWVDWYECYWRHCGLMKADFSLIVNRADSFHGIKLSSVESELGIKMLASFSNVNGGVGLKAVNDGVPLMLQESNGTFATEMNEVISQLAIRLGVVEIDRIEKRNKLPAFLSRILSAVFT